MQHALLTKMRLSTRMSVPILGIIVILSFLSIGMKGQAPVCEAPCTGVADCDDGNSCTDDQCVDGVCSHTAYCDDGDSCTDDQCVGGVCSHTATAQCASEHGFVTLSEEQRYFQFSDGTPFVPIGHVGVFGFDGNPYFGLSVEEEFMYLESHGENTLVILLDGGSATQIELRVGGNWLSMA